MAWKKTKNCCRYCRHYGWGLVRKGQVHEQRVCLMKPKVFKNAVDNIEPHFHAAVAVGWCDKFDYDKGREI